MREKLLDLMKSEGLKPSQLAETLGINPAGISHILAGRNKPGFDLLQKILRRFPRINPDWLLLDAPQMYREQIPGNPTQSQSAVPENEPTGGLFGQPATEPGRPGISPTSVTERPESPRTLTELPVGKKAGVSVTRIVLFYDDQTFESYTPEKTMK